MRLCGSPASRTQRLIDGKPASYDDPIILVGASESYEPRCRHCHESQSLKDQAVDLWTQVEMSKN